MKIIEPDKQTGWPSHMRADISQGQLIALRDELAQAKAIIELWFQFALEVGKKTNCLPSTFPDSNSHILSKIDRMTADKEAFSAWANKAIQGATADTYTQQDRAIAAEIERDTLRDELARLQAERRWIPVGERLPEDNKNVFIFCEYDNKSSLEIGWYNSKFGWSLWCGDDDIDRVTHWMPLPQPPENEV